MLYIFLNVLKANLVIIAERKYLLPCRTQKSSSLVPKILTSYLVGKIGSCQIFIIFASLAQLVERTAVNR